MPEPRLSSVEQSKVYAIHYSNGWHHTASDESAAEARERDLPVIEFVPRDAYRGAISLLERAAALLEASEDFDEQKSELSREIHALVELGLPPVKEA